MKHFNDYLVKYRRENNIRLFFDIETLQYNELEGRKKPTRYKNVVYSVAVSYYDELDLNTVIFPNFKHLFDFILNTLRVYKKKPTFELIAHNTNKYDNHYLRYDLVYYYGLESKNIYLKNATDEGNAYTLKKKELTKEDKQGIILEKRIKSSNNLELDFYIEGIRFYTTDNYVKTAVSIKTLGHKLLRKGLIKEEELKTDFDYVKYNKDIDMLEQQARDYALKVFRDLSSDEITYIRNDVIILAKSVMHYSEIFKGFDYSKITFTSNILQFYNDNDLTSFQLLKKVGKKHIKYTDYRFANENFYDYLKPFYRGGANMYNDMYVGKIINEKVTAIDINSSYPYAMHNFKIPTYIKTFKEFDKENKINVTISNDVYSLYRISKSYFDDYILSRIKSKVLKKLLVKYYNTNDFININSYTIRMINLFTDVPINELMVYSYVQFDCVDFGSKEHISEMYYVKTQGKQENKVFYESPYNIKITDEKNTEYFSPEEIDNSKVVLNGLYGIPALRPFFNLFRWVNNELSNIPNGYVNNERNIVFSIFVTSVSLWNLLSPLQYLEQKEIDDCFIYCDTDSLYLKKKALKKIPGYIFNPYHLGSWDIQNETIDKIFVLNHKKYAYLSENEIIVKCGGIPNEAFDRNMDFETFIDTQFNDGITIENTKGIFNEQGTISIYPSITKLSIGYGYRIFSEDMFTEDLKKQMIDEIRDEMKGEQIDALYIESSIGIFSMDELYPMTREVEKKKHLLYLQMNEDYIKKEINKDR